MTTLLYLRACLMSPVPLINLAESRDPYTLAKDEQWLITHTASMHGGDEAERFQGQPSPELARAGFLKEQFYDEVLFAVLLDR
jgi:hypothetical protein